GDDDVLATRIHGEPAAAGLRDLERAGHGRPERTGGRVERERRDRVRVRVRDVEEGPRRIDDRSDRRVPRRAGGAERRERSGRVVRELEDTLAVRRREVEDLL